MTRLGRSPYRVEAGVLIELQRAWLSGTLTDTRTPIAERERKGRKYAADLREQLTELRGRERAEVDERRDELVAGLRAELHEQREADHDGFAFWMAAAMHLPDEDKASDALAIALRTNSREAAAPVALRALTEAWDDVFTEWCGRLGWPQEEPS